MKRKAVIVKILALVAWFLVISGMATLLIAANGKQKKHVCSDLFIRMKGEGENYYIEREDVEKMIAKAAVRPVIGRPVTDINLASLENRLEKNAWIRNAELYFDSRDVLHVYVEEREPVARVFTTQGASFYMDSSGHRMPLLEKVSARVPVVTGFWMPRQMKAADSAMLKQLKQVAVFLYQDEFWNAQVGQVDITAERKFELIPVIGNHVIRLGSGENVEDKLQRLFVFYKQVMKKAGFSRYAVLDLQYEGQVVAVNRGPVSPVDSLQLQKNIEELMNRASLQQVESEMLPDAGPPVTQNHIPIQPRESANRSVPKAIMKKRDSLPDNN